MDKTAIKNFAIQARKDLIAGVKQKAYEYGIDEKTTGNEASTGALLNGRILTSEEQSQRNELLNLIKTKGYDQVMEEVAYTWFNRFIALRFMEVNEYLPSRIRVFTNEKNEFQPEILSEALYLELEGLNKAKVIKLLEVNQTEELYKYLLITQCNDLNTALPEMFEKIQNYTELLFPNNLLKEGSILACMISNISQNDWTEAVEIIGWLYQYYNTDVKDETFALLSKNIKITKERIPAATQLFTPDWIVRYMVENSLGRLWIEGHPSESLKSNWKYYLDEVEQEPEVDAQLEKIRADYTKIKPEEIKVIDPCMGSGHILVYAFDVLMQIYIATGYSERDAAKSILQNNLFGLDIDDRAYQLSYFAVMMKARKCCRTLFSAGIRPNLYSIQESNYVSSELIDYVAQGDTNIKYDLQAIIETLYDAKEYGSILKIPKANFGEIFNRLYEVQANQTNEIQQLALKQIVIERLSPLMHMAQIMSKKYSVVVTNPPYMGGNGMGVKLSEYVKLNYPDSKSDLFAVFIEKCVQMTNNNSFTAMITQHAWMFLSSFEKIRKEMLLTDTVNMAHLGARAFEEIGGEVVQTTSWVTRKTNVFRYRALYARLVDFKSQNKKEEAFLAKQNLFIAQQDNFSKIPGIPIAYWMTENMVRPYLTEKLICDVLSLKAGLSTADNSKYIRFWPEVRVNRIGFNYENVDQTADGRHKWFPCNSGGEFRKWSTSDEYVIDWQFNGRSLKSQRGAALRNQDYYFQEGITWNKLSSSRFAVKYKGVGYIFDDTSRSAYGKTKDISLYYVVGFFCTKIAFQYLQALNPTMSFTNNDLERLPLIVIQDYHYVEKIVKSNVKISKTDWDYFEISWDFVKHPLIEFKSGAGYGTDMAKWHYKIENSFDSWKDNSEVVFNQLKSNEEELNRTFINIYGLQEELTPEVEDKDITVRKADLGREIRSLLSYAVGVTLGRYSLDIDGLAYAGSKWDDSKYSTIIPDKDNILPISDDMYFEDDIVSKVVNFVKNAFSEETLEENLQFIADALGNRGDSSREVIRNYFINDFYKDHLKIYQKRPIYWLFDSGMKNGFKALIYMHRYQQDLLATMRTDYVHEQQERYRTQLQHLEASMMHASPTDVAKINKRIGKLKEQSLELLRYEEKIHHLADQKINIDLDDGVKVNYAKFEDVLAPIK